MKKLLMTVEAFIGFVSFATMIPKDFVLSLVILTFTLVYVFGVFELSRLPYKLNSHMIVGGMLFLVLSVFIFLRMVAQLDFSVSLPHLLVFLLGFAGLIQIVIVRKTFRQS